MLNGYAFGGYLIFVHVRPFVDARAELYRDPMLSLYDELQSGDATPVETTLKRYGVAWTIFPPDSPAVAALDHEPRLGLASSPTSRRWSMRATRLPEVQGLRGLMRAGACRPFQGSTPRATSSFSRSTPGPK